MAGCRQEAAWLRRWRRDGCPPWGDLFIRNGPRSNLFRCLECGRCGYNGYDQPAPWQVSCLIGHAYRCGDCGALVQNLGRHWDCRTGTEHQVCAQHNDTQWRALQRLVAP